MTEFDPWNPHSKRRELTLASHSLTPHICTKHIIHSQHTKSLNVIKFSFKKKGGGGCWRDDLLVKSTVCSGGPGSDSLIKARICPHMSREWIKRRMHSQLECRTYTTVLNSAFFFLIFILCVVYGCGPFACSALEARRGHWIPGARVMDGCEPLYGCWKLNFGPLQE